MKFPILTFSTFNLLKKYLNMTETDKVNYMVLVYFHMIKTKMRMILYLEKMKKYVNIMAN